MTAAERAWQAWYEPGHDISRAMTAAPHDLMHTAFLAAWEASAAAGRERIRSLGVNPLSGRCAYEAFATATRESLNLPAWDAIPPDARADWQMTADAVLTFADLPGDTP